VLGLTTDSGWALQGWHCPCSWCGEEEASDRVKHRPKMVLLLLVAWCSEGNDVVVVVEKHSLGST
jgi:hypothetical protein